jgi:hypothetical protein
MRDPDDILIDDLRGPPPLDVCREALAFWTRRRDSLSWMRRSARRDAAEMVARWEQRLRDAERAERARRPWRRVLDALGIDWPALADRHLPSRRRVTAIVTGGLVAISAFLVATAVLFVALAYAIVSQLG